jgi:hypothetical protein
MSKLVNTIAWVGDSALPPSSWPVLFVVVVVLTAAFYVKLEAARIWIIRPIVAAIAGVFNAITFVLTAMLARRSIRNRVGDLGSWFGARLTFWRDSSRDLSDSKTDDENDGDGQG